jgi:O-glycosyl hydrolase
MRGHRRQRRTLRVRRPTETRLHIEVVRAIGKTGSSISFEGFGAAGACDAAEFVAFAPENPAIYDVLFGTRASGQGLGLDILRIKNTYQHPGDTNLAAAAAIVSAGKARNPNLKTQLAAWSPIASLKSNADIRNGGSLVRTVTTYTYIACATWWADSLALGWAASGVTPDYVSIQNEPDASTKYESCLLASSESASHAGYNAAFDTVHAAIAARVPRDLPAMPRMIGPESTGYAAGPSTVAASRGARDHTDNLTTAGKANIYAYALHPYADGRGGESG